MTSSGPSPDHPADKWAVGVAAAALVEDDMLLGIGTGSTVAAFLDALDQRRQRGELDAVVGVPTSEQTAARCRQLGFGLRTPADVPELDLCIDGADELTADLVLTKGGGGALLREKVVATMSRRFVVIVGADKVVERLGATFPLPVEVVPFAVGPVTRALADIGRPEQRHDERGEPVLTDNGNAIVDLSVPEGIAEPGELAGALSGVPGVAEHGLFVDLATSAIIGTGSGDTRTMASA